MEKQILLVDSHHGICSPKFFVENYEQLIENKDKFEFELKDCLNPDSESYWDSFIRIEDAAILLIDGFKYYIYQSDDIWAIHEDYAFNDAEELVLKSEI